ncbi:MAG: hypothetical protein HY329_17165 [Chloroflexi bacterium]|nr:hypothetical protein [Chloroflexota bacterium]
MGKASRDKGARRELEFAKLVGGQRVPLSGAAGGHFGEDVRLPNGWLAQCKARADGWRTLYADLGQADLLALKADRRPWLVVVPLGHFLELLGGTPDDAA